MFAVITNPNYWKEIEEFIDNKNTEILFHLVTTDADIIMELEKVAALPIKYLIIDITTVSDESKLIQGIRRYRIKKDNVQLIIIAPNRRPGNDTISKLVGMGIYDIINPLINENNESDHIIDRLNELVDTPATYSKAVRWDKGASENIDIRSEGIKTKNKEVREKEVVERTVTIIKDKIVGTVVIAVAGTMSRIGTTHTIVGLANFLNNQGFKVAVLEMNDSGTFNSIRAAYKDTIKEKNLFILNNIIFYPYSENISVSELLQEDYNYLLFDMGNYNECNLDEFRRASVKILVSGVKEWEVINLENILKNSNDMYLSKYKYLFNFSDINTYKIIKDGMDKLETFRMVYNPNPFLISKDMSIVYNSLLKDFLPSQKTNNKNKLSFLNLFFGKENLSGIFK